MVKFLILLRFLRIRFVILIFCILIWVWVKIFVSNLFSRKPTTAILRKKNFPTKLVTLMQRKRRGPTVNSTLSNCFNIMRLMYVLTRTPTRIVIAWLIRAVNHFCAIIYNEKYAVGDEKVNFIYIEWQLLLFKRCNIQFIWQFAILPQKKNLVLTHNQRMTCLVVG